MNYYDPRRPRLANGLPAWLTAPSIALPALVISPEPTLSFKSKWRLAFMINGSFKYLEAYIVDCILEDWLESPEAFALSKFGVIPTASVSDHNLPTPAEPIDPASLGF